MTTKNVSFDAKVSDPFTNMFGLLGRHIEAPEDRVRDRIVAAAKRRFLEQGFARVTVEGLCRELRISKKTFYKHFTDKEDLVLGVMAGTARIVFPRLVALNAEDMPPVQRLDALMDFVAEFTRRHVSIAFLADVQAIMPELWDAIDAIRHFNLNRFFELIEEGQAAGIYRKDIDAKKFARLFTLVLERVVDPRLLYQEGLQVGEVVGMFLEVVRHGLHVQPGGAREES